MPTEITSWDFLKQLHQADDKIAVYLWNTQGHTVPFGKDQTPSDTHQVIITAGQAAAPDFQRWLRYLNAQGFNVAVSMNPLRDDARGRTKADIKSISTVYLDLDTKYGSTGKDKLDAILADPDCPKPTFVLQTSAENYQAIWKVREFTTEQARDTLRLLAAHYGGDRAIGGDEARVLRVPGFYNRKHDPIFQIDGRQLSTTLRSPAAFDYLKQRCSLPASADRPTLAASSVGHAGIAGAIDTSASARDWSHCLRELKIAYWNQASGNQIEDLYARLHTELAQRASDRGKHDPEYYARVTIGKVRQMMVAEGPLAAERGRAAAAERRHTKQQVPDVRNRPPFPAHEYDR